MSKQAGNNHVEEVAAGLKKYIKGHPLINLSETTMETINYIQKLYPNTIEVISKFDTNAPDLHPDLLLLLKDRSRVPINLFFIKGKAAIQPKNLGAKSFLDKYFLLPDIQRKFNNYVDQKYIHFLRDVLETKGYVYSAYDKMSDLKQKVKLLYPKFAEEIETIRKNFLYSLRENCFELLREEYNDDNKNIDNAFNELLLVASTNIITRHTEGNKCLFVEEFKPKVDPNQKVNIYKKGNYSIGIQSGEEVLLLRFKFESSPYSAIKLATSHEKRTSQNNIIDLNLQSLKKFETLLNSHQHVLSDNISNAIGKCNEAMIYYQFLKENPLINQVDEKEYQNMIKRYMPSIIKEDLIAIKNSSVVTIKRINNHLSQKYSDFKIDSIQLVPDSYIKNRLDTSDLKIILNVAEELIEECLSLKALAKRSSKFTAKNPGIGQILGPQYFDIDNSFPSVVLEVREKFISKKYNHQQCMESLSKEIGMRLLEANQENIRKGVRALIGSTTTVVTFYRINDSIVLEHENITSDIEVCNEYPTPIQTTLFWHNKQEEISMRVKFSSGQTKGWSSVKLACDYKINIK